MTAPKRQKQNFSDENWLHASVNALDESARDLDAASLSRLNRARQIALAELKPNQSSKKWTMGTLALVCAGALAFVVAPRFDSRDQIPVLIQTNNDTALMEEFELLSSEDQLEMLENLEFYAWLDAQTSAAG